MKTKINLESLAKDAQKIYDSLVQAKLGKKMFEIKNGKVKSQRVDRLKNNFSALEVFCPYIIVGYILNLQLKSSSIKFNQDEYNNYSQHLINMYQNENNDGIYIGLGEYLGRELINKTNKNFAIDISPKQKSKIKVKSIFANKDNGIRIHLSIYNKNGHKREWSIVIDDLGFHTDLG